MHAAALVQHAVDRGPAELGHLDELLDRGLLFHACLMQRGGRKTASSIVDQLGVGLQILPMTQFESLIDCLKG